MFAVAPDGQSAACHLEDGRIPLLELRWSLRYPRLALGEGGQSHDLAAYRVSDGRREEPHRQHLADQSLGSKFRRHGETVG